MTTTLSAPASPTKPIHAKRARSQPRVSLKMIALTVGILLVGALVAGAALWTSSSDASAEVQYATVTPRTFNVVLKEKGELKAAKSTDIKCEVEGRSTIISLIPEGTAVQEGDLLVVLASDEIENKIRESELKEANAITAYEAARAELDIQRDKNASDIRKADLLIEIKDLELKKYEQGDWAQKLKDAEIAIEQAEITLKRRKDDFDASQQLFEKKYTTQTEFEEAKFNFLKAGWDLEKAKMAMDVLKKYTYVADLKQKQSDLEEASKEAERTRKNAEAEETKKLRNVEGRQKELELIQDQLAKFRAQKDKCRILAPTQGFVVYYSGGGGRWMSNEQQIKEGAEVFERQVLMQLPDTSSMMVALRIHEAKTDKLRLGQPVNVTIEALPGRTFTGTVQKIAALADSQSSWLNPDLKEYETEILLDSTEVPLKPGVTAHAEILVETVEDQLAVPVQAIFAKSGKRYVFRQFGAGAEPVPVQVASVGNEWAAIASGLNSGDRILLSFDDSHRRLIPDLDGEERLNGQMPQRRRGPGGPGGGRPGAHTAGPRNRDGASDRRVAEPPTDGTRTPREAAVKLDEKATTPGHASDAAKGDAATPVEAASKAAPAPHGSGSSGRSP